MINWNITENDKVFFVQRTFPDGTDVILSIICNEGIYEVWSSAESRTSGPNNSLDGTADSFEKAKKILLDEISGWEEDLL